MSDIRIVLVDDHAIVRQGLRTILSREPGLAVVGEAAAADVALALIDETRPDIVLLDLKLSTSSDSEGLTLCSQITTRYPEIKVLVLTTFLDEWLVMESIKQGAKGYVVKDVDAIELVRAIRAVQRGESAFDAHSAAMLVRSLNGNQGADDVIRQITPREREVLALLARGMSNVAIGKELFISETTVKFHVSNVMRKLGVTRRAEAVYAASKIGLI
ncbi:DNA-binding response regulator [Carbonactinospora thermoautotrophica]|nr:response regulator transcription factor [Carbonactinospora thermoautotrophica]KWX01156.1 putative NarL family two-component response regulator [Carbonactinospora thermoautotrophica]MCX9192376.1 DNA-binding response regulator [Carbonactinospora thermoautotrophica]